MPVSSNFHRFGHDSRGNRLAAWDTMPCPDGHILLLRGPQEVVFQLVSLAPEYRPRYRGPDGSFLLMDGRWTHALHSPEVTMKTKVRRLLTLLEQVLSLPAPPSTDVALTLDWYKIPEEGVDPAEWINTENGELVSLGKYSYKWDGRRQSEVGLKLVRHVCRAIDQHALLGSSTVILNIPGHDSSQVSFGSRLADTVARDCGIRIVKVLASSAFRPEVKNLGRAERAKMLENQFSVPVDLAQQAVLIVDDVFQSGASMSAVASAARRSGACFVSGITCVRTMRR
jgi:hypothetical protein